MNPLSKSINTFQSWFPIANNETTDRETLQTNYLESAIAKENNIPEVSDKAALTDVAFHTLQSIAIIFSNIKSTAVNYWEKRNIELTTTKIKKVFLSILGLYSLLSVYIISGSIIPTTLSSLALSAPLTALSAAIFMYSLNLKDYDNQSCLKEIKESCQHLALKEIVKIHSWENIFKYELVDQKKLSEGFLQLIQELSFKEALDIYIKTLKKNFDQAVKEKKPSLEIPKPCVWKEKFFHEIKDQTIESIVNNYDLKTLASFKIISLKQSELLEKAKTVIEEKNLGKKDILKTLQEALSNELTIIYKDIEASIRNLNDCEMKKNIILEILEKKQNFETNFSTLDNYFSQQNLDEKSLFSQETKNLLQEVDERLQTISSDMATCLKDIQQDFISSINNFPQSA